MIDASYSETPAIESRTARNSPRRANRSAATTTPVYDKQTQTPLHPIAPIPREAAHHQRVQTSSVGHLPNNRIRRRRRTVVLARATCGMVRDVGGWIWCSVPCFSKLTREFPRRSMGLLAAWSPDKTAMRRLLDASLVIIGELSIGLIALLGAYEWF